MEIKSNKKNKSDAEDLKKLLKSARLASINAQRISAALGLPIQTISNGRLIEKSLDGKIKTIKVIVRAKSNRPGIKKGTILCLK